MPLTITVFNFFDKIDDTTAKCIFCSNNINFNHEETLINHLTHNHSVDWTMLMEKKKKFWSCFTVVDEFNRTAKCNLCDMNLAYRSTTGNLKSHLSRSHYEIYRALTKDAGSSNKSKNEVELPSDSSDLWNYFEKEYGNRARCILCLRIFSRSVGVLKDHLAQKHQKKSENEESDTEFGRDDDQNCYTEIVYLEDEEPKPEPISKPIIIQKRPEPKKRKVPSYEPEETYNEEVENFGKYVTSLLKKLPKDLCTQLQMDIVNLIMKAKLNNMAAKMAPNVTSVGGNTSFMVTLPNVSNSNESITVINNVKNSLDPL